MSHHMQDMLKVHPHTSKMKIDKDMLISCIQASSNTAQTCMSCADACIGDKDIQSLIRCIRINLDCADICSMTSRLLCRQTEMPVSLLRSQLQACQMACQGCGQECQEHASKHEYCRVCADYCRQCEDACNKLLSSL